MEEEKKKKLPLSEKLAWGTGGFSEQLAANGLNNLFIPIYNIGLGLDSVLIGWAISIPRFFDMVSDPLMGNLSDNFRSRFGRRRPFILAGSILMALMFALAYMASPFWGSWTLFAYAVVVCILFYLAYTVYSVPFSALGLELTDDYDERADVQKYRMVFASFGALSIPWLYKICISTGQHVQHLLEEGGAERYRFLLRPVAALSAENNIAPEVLGVRYVAWIAAALIILTALPASLLTREKVRVGAATWSGLYGSTTGAFSLASTFLIPVLVRLFDKKKVLLAGADTMSPETVVRLRLFVALFPSTCLLPAILNFGATR